MTIHDAKQTYLLPANVDLELVIRPRTLRKLRRLKLQEATKRLQAGILRP